MTDILTPIELRRLGRSLYANDQWEDIFKRNTFFISLLPYLRAINEETNSNKPLLSEIQRSNVVFSSIFRPYVNKNWNIRKRIAAISGHYRQLETNGAALLDLPDSHYFDLMTLAVSGQEVRIVVDRPKWLRCEGEVCLSLVQERNRIYSAMFLLGRQGNSRQVLIGGFQGRTGPDSKELYVKLTRSFHGLRPRDLLINALKFVSTNVGAETIKGITSECHRSKHAFVRTLYHGPLPYDAVWADHRGKPDGDGFLEFPALFRKRCADEIPTNKRAQYRRRYEMLDAMQNKIGDVFATGRRTLIEFDR